MVQLPFDSSWVSLRLQVFLGLLCLHLSGTLSRSITQEPVTMLVLEGGGQIAGGLMAWGISKGLSANSSLPGWKIVFIATGVFTVSNHVYASLKALFLNDYLS